jgi:hypothetical protein
MRKKKTMVKSGVLLAFWVAHVHKLLGGCVLLLVALDCVYCG